MTRLYEPPPIRDLDQVRERIRGHTAFRINTTLSDTGLQIHSVDYAWLEQDMFPDPFLLECRGLLFNNHGDLIARPLHKFFNLGERPEHDRQLPGDPAAFTLHAKHDGCLVTLAPLPDGSVTLCTRGGRTGLARHIEDRMQALDPGLLRRLRDIARDATPSLEYTGPDNPVVLAYRRPALTLLALRRRHSGRYLPLPSGLPAAHPLENNLTLRQAARRTRASTAPIEGYVAAFPCGHRVKIKTDRYTRIHAAVSSLAHEKHALSVILHDNLDDLLPQLPPGHANILRTYARDVSAAIRRLSGRLQLFCDRHRHLPQKQFAARVHTEQPRALRPLCFRIRTAPGTAEHILRNYFARKLARSATTVEAWRPLIPLPDYPETFRPAARHPSETSAP